MNEKGNLSGNLAKHAAKSAKVQSLFAGPSSARNMEFNRDQIEFIQNRELKLNEMSKQKIGNGISLQRLSLEPEFTRGQFETAEINDIGPDWAMDFRTQSDLVSINSVPSHRQFIPTEIPLMHFNNFPAQSYSDEKGWSEEFKKQAAELNGSHWAEEFSKQIETEDIASKDYPDALAKTAGKILETVAKSENEKFKNSKFMAMMQKFRDGELYIEGDKLVEAVADLSHKKTSINEIHDESVTLNSINNGNILAEEFLMNEAKDIEYLSNLTDDPLPSSYKMAQEFASNSLNWNEEFNATSPPGNFALPLGSVKGKRNMAPLKSSDVSHDFDLDQIQKDMLNGAVDIDSHRQQQSDSNWQSNFQDMNLNDKSKKESWNQFEQDYRNFEKDNLESNVFATMQEYEPFKLNPYTSLSKETLAATAVTNNLMETILKLEALVEKDPTNTGAWFELGKKQQENENDSNAIAALQKSIALDPQNLEAYLAIAVSFTNENMTFEAYNSITDWINNNPIYSNIDGPTPLSSMQRHEMLVQSLVHAAMSNPGQDLDPNVQLALGVLFNISSEYSKAIDCFETAISVAPNDFDLWNKLGATLANSGHPEKAMEAYFKALELNPAYIRTRYNLAVACMQIGQVKVLII
jgi:peroxin-5